MVDCSVVLDVKSGHIFDVLIIHSFLQSLLNLPLLESSNRMGKKILPGDPFIGIVNKHLFENILYLWLKAGVLGELKGTLLDLLQKLGDVLGCIGILPENHLIKTNPNGPDISLIGVLFSRQNLWRHVQRGAQHSIGEVVLPEHFGESEIRDLNNTVVLEDIRELKIPVHNIVCVESLEPVQNLTKVLHGVLL